MGGSVPEVSYEQVCGGQTGHAEAIHLRFDPDKISYAELLEIFWANIDPTSVNRQGPNIGEQYRSAIFFYDEDQESIARQSLAQLSASGKWQRPIATAILPADSFWPADQAHQQYYERNGMLDAFFAAREGVDRND